GRPRWLGELAHRLAAQATALAARCDATGGPTFAPLADALRTFLCLETGGSADAVRAAVVAALPPENLERARIPDGLCALRAGSPASPEETFFALRRFLAALAARRSVV